jgi:hypothetical protein
MRKDVGRANVLYVHVTLLPALAATGELKTKPTQHSVKELRGIGIQPDVIVLRSDHPVPDEIREKIALFTDVATDAVIPAETADTIYEVPLMFEAAGLGRLVVRELGLGDPEVAPDLDSWRALVARIKAPKPVVEIALVGKYIELPDAYLSVTEALRHAAWAHEDTRRVDRLTFGLGCGIAGIAGAAFTMIGSTGPTAGQLYIVDTFLVVVFGGAQSLVGTIASAFTISQSQSTLEFFMSGSMAKVLTLLIVIGLLMLRPQGLFVLKVRR